MSGLYEDLGVPRDASVEAIKLAYRKIAMREHPDRGGSAERFWPIQRAYETLSDPVKRARYDETGQVEGARDARSELLQQLAALFLGAIDACDVDHTDIVAKIREALLQAKEQQRAAIGAHGRKIAVRKRACQRVSRKGGGDNLLLQFIEGDIAHQQQAIEMKQAEIAKLEQLLAFLDEYQYAVDRAPAVASAYTKQAAGSGFYSVFGLGPGPFG